MLFAITIFSMIVLRYMKIFVAAKTRAKKEYVKKTSERGYTVAVSAAPEKGRANAAIATGIAACFDIARSRVRLVSGATTKQKVFEIS